MRHTVVRTFDEWLAQESVPHYPYEKSFEEAASDPFIVIHTSGSTGLPKPVILRHGGLATADAHHVMPPSDGYHPQVTLPTGERSLPTGERPPRIFASLPPFHVSNYFSEPIPFYHLPFIDAEISGCWHTGPTGSLALLSPYNYLAARWPTNQRRRIRRTPR